MNGRPPTRDTCTRASATQEVLSSHRHDAFTPLGDRHRPLQPRHTTLQPKRRVNQVGALVWSDRQNANTRTRKPRIAPGVGRTQGAGRTALELEVAFLGMPGPGIEAGSAIFRTIEPLAMKTDVSIIRRGASQALGQTLTWLTSFALLWLCNAAALLLNAAETSAVPHGSGDVCTRVRAELH